MLVDSKKNRRTSSHITEVGVISENLPNRVHEKQRNWILEYIQEASTNDYLVIQRININCTYIQRLV